MKKTLTIATLCLCFFSLTVLAQKDELNYQQKAAQIQAKVWGDKAPEFELKTIPVEMEKESAVIIAKSINIQQATGGRLKIGIVLPTSATRTNKIICYRERVKINDKAALASFSKLSYQKTLDQTQGFLHIRAVNTEDTYIGIKILKPGGKEEIVNIGEEVFTKNEVKDKQGKLAIPGLQVGDILDYYITRVSTEETFDTNAGDEISTYVLAGEYPILNYELKLQYAKKMNVDLVQGNGAPDFTITTDENNDKIYDLKTKDLGKMEDTFWTSFWRQYPYIKVETSYTNKYLNFLSGISDKHDRKKSQMENSLKEFENILKENIKHTDYKSNVKKYFKTDKAFKDASVDSVMRVFYDYLKYYRSFGYSSIEVDPAISSNIQANKIRTLFEMNFLAHGLADMNFKFDILFVATKNGSRLDNVNQLYELRPLIRFTEGNKFTYADFYDPFSHFNKIPASCQGEEALVLSHKGNNISKFELSRLSLPIAPASANYKNSQIDVSLNPDNMTSIRVNRSISEDGSMRAADQRILLSRNDITGFYANMLKETPIAANAIDLESFTKEVKLEFGQEPKNLANCKISSAGLSSVNPVFSFSASFELEGLVKNVGNDYIFSVGKMIGQAFKVEGNQRQRACDIYMPAARTFSYDININIPKGYRVKGIEELNNKIKNDVGEVITTALLKGNSVSIKVVRIFEHNFEKAIVWPRLLELLDAAYDLSSQKVLFEKM